MSTTTWIILVAVNAPVYFLLGWVIFGALDDFWEAVRFWLTPDIISLFRGEWGEDCWGEMKLGLWIISCVGCVLGEAQLIWRVFG